jgi:hypothetical protein
LREKRDKLTSELPYIPEREIDIQKKNRRAARAGRRKKFDEENAERNRKMLTVIKRSKGDDLS